MGVAGPPGRRSCKRRGHHGEEGKEGKGEEGEKDQTEKEVSFSQLGRRFRPSGFSQRVSQERTPHGKDDVEVGADPKSC